MKRIVPYFLIMSLSACVTGYQSSTWTGGYSEELIAEGSYHIKYQGNGTTSKELVLQRWHKRAAELCAKGYDVLSVNTEIDTRSIMATGGGLYIPFSSDHPLVEGKVNCKS